MKKKPLLMSVAAALTLAGCAKETPLPLPKPAATAAPAPAPEAKKDEAKK